MRPSDEGFLESLKQDYEAVKTPPRIAKRTLATLESQQLRNSWLRPALAVTVVCSLLIGVWMSTSLLQEPTSALRLALPSLGSPPSVAIKKPAVDIRIISGLSAFPLLPPSPRAPQKPSVRPHGNAGYLFPVSFKPHLV